jgi:ubiquinone biosynthesis protein COQ9
MSLLPEITPERDEALLAMLPLVAVGGWNRGTLRRALASIGAPTDDADFLFPGGPIDMVEAYCDLADRRMAAAFDPSALAPRAHVRVRALIALRFEQARPHRAAVRRAVALLALPRNARVGTRSLARTVDAIWHAAGDGSSDFSWYTKRVILAGVYGASLLFWLRDESLEATDTIGFLDRRLKDVGRLSRLIPRRRQTQS